MTENKHAPLNTPDAPATAAETPATAAVPPDTAAEAPATAAVPPTTAALQGELMRRPSPTWLQVLFVFTGIIILRALLRLFARYALGWRRTATLGLNDGVLTLNEESSLFGKRIRAATTAAPIARAQSLRLENRKRYLYLLVGFGGLTIGIWVGIQFIVDGLNAGYPYLSLIGAGIVAAGVLLDALLYMLVPAGEHRTRLYVQLGRWQHVMTGLDAQAAAQFVQTAATAWTPQR
ncbi:MAG: hypothetical protein GX146_00085 [Myxococcales bacterium]|jgi:hypothetical protein|nr:hypothetical protein [Myxococcales bacterium]